MNICFVCNEYPPGKHGGLGTFTRVLGRALVRAGHGVRVTGYYPAAYGGKAHECDEGVEVWRHIEPEGRLGWIAARHAVYRQVAGWARAGEVDLVEVADWFGPAAGWPRLPVPVVARLNGSATFFADQLNHRVGRMAFALERASLRRVDAWSSASAFTAERTRALFKLQKLPATVLYNPVEPPDAPVDAVARSATRVVFTGTLTEKKGVVSLIRAWPAVLAAVPTAELHLYGKDATADGGGSMRAHLTGLLASGGAGGVTFHGHVPRDAIFSALQQARAAVFPSYAEAFGIAPFEAMVRGCPTIYTAREPGPELVRDGIDGLLVDPDDPGAIAGALVRLLRDDALAADLGVQGRRRVLERYSSSVLLPQNEAFFARAVADFRR